MTLSLNDNDRVKISLTATVDIDPASATVVLLIDGAEYPCSWTGDATTSGGTWTRQAVTNGYLAGPAVPTAAVSGATVLTYGSHTLEIVVTNGPVIKATVLPPFRITT